MVIQGRNLLKFDGEMYFVILWMYWSLIKVELILQDTFLFFYFCINPFGQIFTLPAKVDTHKSRYILEASN